ncbi:MAG: DUF4919 domain-containing protein [Candidatus Atribacteria bacterium]|nr:DUF4919 domain-containing protein [Candidatus Atribacteria bacterium]
MCGRVLLFSFAVVVVFSLFVSPVGRCSPGDYETWLARLKSGDTGIDFARLRRLFIELPDEKRHRNFAELEQKETALLTALEEKKPEEAIRLGNEILEKDYLRVTTHNLLADAYGTMGDTAKQEFHSQVAFALFDAFIRSGEGSNPEKAKVAINPDEATLFLAILGFQEEIHEVVEKDGKVFEHFRGKTRMDSDPQDFWFEITSFYRFLPGEGSTASVVAPEKSPPPGYYGDPEGFFEVVLPPGTKEKGSCQEGIIFAGPGKGVIYLFEFTSQGSLESITQILAGGKVLQGQTTLTVSGREAQVYLYTFLDKNEEYAMVMVLYPLPTSFYPSTPVCMVIVVPASDYEASRGWIETTITGIRFLR